MSIYKRVREFLEEEDASADSIEAEFDNIADSLEGGLTLPNFAEGAAPTGGGASSSTQVDLTELAVTYTIIASTTFVTLPVKSKLLFIVAADIAVTQNSAQTTPTRAATGLWLDGAFHADIACAVGIGLSAASPATNRAISANSGWVTLAAGAHQLAVTASLAGTASQSFASVYGFELNYLAIPTT